MMSRIIDFLFKSRREAQNISRWEAKSISRREEQSISKQEVKSITRQKAKNRSRQETQSITTREGQGISKQEVKSITRQEYQSISRREDRSIAPMKNKSVLQGCWGEQVAVNYLNGKGWTVTAQRVRPCAKDLRCEIDLIIMSKDRKSLVFVEVKTHKKRSRFAGRLWSVNRRKKSNLLRACSNWLMHNHWHGNFRFDVIEVYGSFDSPEPPEIDHIENVPLFPAKWRFW